MSKRNKSRLTKADLGSVLKLQQDYDNLCQDVLQLMMFILDYEQLNVVRRNIKSSDDYVTLCYEKIYEAIQSGRYASKESVKESVADDYAEFQRKMLKEPDSLFSGLDIMSRFGNLKNHRDFNVAKFLEQYATERDGIVYVPMFRVLDALIQNGKPYTEG
jgi:hypothetical protein